MESPEEKAERRRKMRLRRIIRVACVQAGLECLSSSSYGDAVMQARKHDNRTPAGLLYHLSWPGRAPQRRVYLIYNHEEPEAFLDSLVWIMKEYPRVPDLRTDREVYRIVIDTGSLHTIKEGWSNEPKTTA